MWIVPGNPVHPMSWIRETPPCELAFTENLFTGDFDNVYRRCLAFLQTFFYCKFLEDISPFCGATDTTVLDFWWPLPWVSKPWWIPHLCASSSGHNGVNLTKNRKLIYLPTTGLVYLKQLIWIWTKEVLNDCIFEIPEINIRFCVTDNR